MARRAISNSIYIPPGYAQGHQTRTPVVDTNYRIDPRHAPSEDLMIAWSDLEFAISWPLPPTIMSTKVTSPPPVSGLGEELFRVEGRVE